MEAGKDHWLTPRKEPIMVKGKGEMNVRPRGYLSLTDMLPEAHLWIPQFTGFLMARTSLTHMFLWHVHYRHSG